MQLVKTFLTLLACFSPMLYPILVCTGTAAAAAGSISHEHPSVSGHMQAMRIRRGMLPNGHLRMC
jgi:hypothetical protein